MDWTNENVMKFLELYEMRPCIWDPKNSSHKNKTKINEAWLEIQNNMGPLCTVKELKKKRESLMSAYRGYRTKIKKTEISGASSSDLYQPTWFAYKFMHSFLGPIYKCNAFMSTEVNKDQQTKNLNIDLDHTDDRNTDGETDASNTEEERPLRASQGIFMSQYMNQTLPAATAKRRLLNPPEYQQIKNQMDQPFTILKTETQSKHNDEEDDESSDFGKIVAKKLRKLSEDRRDLLMIKINQVIYDERQEHIRSNSIINK